MGDCDDSVVVVVVRIMTNHMKVNKHFREGDGGGMGEVMGG